MIWAFLEERFGVNGAKAVLFGSLVLALFFVALTLFLLGKSSGANHEQLKQAEREIKVQQKIGDATTNAASRRVEDAVVVLKQKEELDEALRSVPDADRQRVVRGCIILRQQGRDTSRLPACTGSASRP